jgi:hypothetical protein
MIAQKKIWKSNHIGKAKFRKKKDHKYFLSGF